MTDSNMRSLSPGVLVSGPVRTEPVGVLTITSLRESLELAAKGFGQGTRNLCLFSRQLEIE